MIAYPWSVLGYFAIGVCGAAAFLVISLLFDKNVAMIENRVISDNRVMSAIYIMFGGILSAVVNVAANPEFGPNQYLLAFAVGMGWPAVAAGIGASKRVGDLDEKARNMVKEKADSSFAAFDKQIQEMKKYYEERLAGALNSANVSASSPSPGTLRPSAARTVGTRTPGGGP